MGEQSDKWWDTMIKKHGSKEAVQDSMRSFAAKSKKNLGGSGGFASLSGEKLAEVSAKGGRKSKRRAKVQ